jgi:hypothetical protein
MNTKHNRKRLVTSALGAAAAAVAVPAVLFAGAGTAQADTQVTILPGVSVGIPTTTTMNVAVTDKTGYNGEYGNCLYHAVPVAGTGKRLNFPPADHQFNLPKFGTATFSFDVLPTGTIWEVKVNCAPGYSLNVYDNPDFVW